MLPKRRKYNSNRAHKAREYPSHRAWVRGFPCVVPGCEDGPIEAAHCRRNTDGGTSLKPHDKWVFPACRKHHAEQHRADLTFEAKYKINTRQRAIEFAAASPHRFKWLDEQ